MTIQGLTSKICRCIDYAKVFFYTDSMLKELMKRTQFIEVRVKIWKKLGNEIGEDSYINNNIILIDNRKMTPNVVLGDRVALSPYVTFITDSAPNKSRMATCDSTTHFLRSGSITVGNDTWIGTNTVIHPGVAIGKNCIIGACSNVTHDIPDNSVAYGNPARIIKKVDFDSIGKES